jgi:hypothetical protein
MGAIIVNRPKLRFSRGVGVDDLMDEITARKAGKQPRRRNPKAEKVTRILPQDGTRLNSDQEVPPTQRYSCPGEAFSSTTCSS